MECTKATAWEKIKRKKELYEVRSKGENEANAANIHKMRDTIDRCMKETIYLKGEAG